MGIKEQEFFHYIEDFLRFADLMNGTVFKGKQIVKPKYLRKMPRKKSVLVSTYTENTTEEKNSSFYENRSVERERDIFLFHDQEENRFYLACEVQLYADYIMPLRNFTYDGVGYSDQVKTKFGAGAKTNRKVGKAQVSRPLIPVIHNVLYLGEKRWLSKYRLQEMMEIPKTFVGFEDLLPDYHINLVDIHEQNPELFHTEWRDVFRLMRHSRKKKELKKYMEENMEKIQKLSAETRRFMAVLLDQYEILEDEKVEVKDVCKAWDGAMMMYREEALEQGIQQGLAQANRNTARNMYNRGYSAKDVAGIVQVPLETVINWYQEFENMS